MAADRIARAIERGRLFELERAARERSEFLERTNAVLTRSLEIPDIMRRVAQAAVPRLGDWCQLAVFTDEQSNVPTIEVAHVDPDKLAWAQELRDRFPYDPDALTGIPAAVRSGTTQYYPEINDELIDLATPNRDVRDVLKRLRVRSSIVVPLRGRTRHPRRAPTRPGRVGAPLHAAPTCSWPRRSRRASRSRSRTRGSTNASARSPARCSRACSLRTFPRSPASRSRTATGPRATPRSSAATSTT